MTLFSGISRGTEALVFSGAVPPSEFFRMRAPHQHGEFPFPVKYGYSTVVRRETDDRLCFALHPHQDAFNIDPKDLVELPNGLDPQRAILAANMETALNAIWDGGVLPAHRVCVVGAGTLGCLIGYLCARIPEVDVTLIDPQPNRREIAEQLGCTFSQTPPPATEFDIVFHCSATPEGLDTAFALARHEGRVIEVSWYGNRQVGIGLGGGFHSKRLQLISSQVGTVAPSMRQSHTHRQRLEAALRLLRDPALDCLLARAIPFKQAAEALPEIFTGKQSGLCQPLSY
ncbi:zinc-binding alcohol dehydrogenase [Pseudovibrio exalbescens]|uniref:zinc-dependent alcohol dehydrogenase n=1 Tax=Pseudovibrio exalbescens TaxID=197461 RepID=UPI002366D670|nr:zinc-binding alcohol dehydrogenase [Pseudovibrio exalbescens]MDD7909903.1 zinc-binding alcohol dehydrogenase [Pseudovibrio exalbescens]